MKSQADLEKVLKFSAFLYFSEMARRYFLTHIVYKMPPSMFCNILAHFF